MVTKKHAFPEPSLGEDFKKIPKILVPDQSLSLKEILTRFTRGEAVPVGKQGEFDDEADEDLEKLANADLVDKAEFIDRMEQIRRAHDKQEKAKAKREAEAKLADAKAAEDKRVRIAARKLAKQNLAK